MREFVLDRAFSEVKSKARLRQPQREGLAAFHELWKDLDTRLADASRKQVLQRVADREPSWTFGGDFPHVNFDIATGVGKTRLMGAIVAYLFRSGESTNFVILAPRRAILRKTLAVMQPSHDQYFFVDQALVPPPTVWHSGNVADFAQRQTALFQAPGPNVFVFSPQALIGENRKIANRSEFVEASLLEYLQAQDDVVVLMDEAHHLGKTADDQAAAWTEGIRELNPRFQIGMTATVRSGDGGNVVYSYSLRQCLREQKYTKDVNLVVRRRSDDDSMPDSEWDRVTLQYAISRLEKKEAAVGLLDPDDALADVKPVLLVAAVDTEHAEDVGEWLRGPGGFDAEEVLVTHSRRSKSEDELDRLLTVESPLNPVRVVVNVYELTEGWDVTNVYVIAPLRLMASYEGALQTMGRGLRLPAGRRVGSPELDTLDVLCFGKAELHQIVESATQDFGEADDQEAFIQISTPDDDDINLAIEVELSVATAQTISMPMVEKDPPEIDLDFDVRSSSRFAGRGAYLLGLADLQVAGDDEVVSFDRQVFIDMVTSYVLKSLSYLSDPLHREGVSLLVERVLAVLNETGQRVPLDVALIAEGLGEEIDKRYRRQEATYRIDPSSSIQFALSDATVRSPGEPEELSSPDAWNRKQHLRRPIRCSAWTKSVYDFSPFDSRGEVWAANTLDASTDVMWWARNDPFRIRIPTPIGGYHPDLFARLAGTGNRYLLLEVKMADLWRPVDSDARVKARAAAAWVEAINASATAPTLEYLVVLDVDAKAAGSLQGLRQVGVGP